MRSAGKGRFSSPADPKAAKFSRSVHFDQRLARYDLRGSRAHATMLGRIGVLTRKEVAAIVRGWMGWSGRSWPESFVGKIPWKMCI